MDIKIVELFFFKAILAGWVTESKKKEVPQMPGYKAIDFELGDYHLRDCYCVNPGSSKSAGTTTIWFNQTPVWFMSYRGFYEESAIPFLKEALLLMYQKHQFVGGRGPLQFSKNELIYNNSPRIGSTFEEFEGREQIINLDRDPDNGLMGYHEYSGMSLLGHQ